MKWIGVVLVLVGVVGGSAGAFGATATAGDAANVAHSTSASEQTCRACHAIDTTKVGPPFRAISERYRGDPDAVAKLEKSMLEGSSGKWNTGASMPANAISHADAERFARWILGVK